MSNKYILLKESDLDSRIEELDDEIKRLDDSSPHDWINIREKTILKYKTERQILQSLKQKGEVVELSECEIIDDLFYNGYTKTVEDVRAGKFHKYLTNKGYKLIKKV